MPPPPSSSGRDMIPRMDSKFEGPTRSRAPFSSPPLRALAPSHHPRFASSRSLRPPSSLPAYRPSLCRLHPPLSSPVARVAAGATIARLPPPRAWLHMIEQSASALLVPRVPITAIVFAEPSWAARRCACDNGSPFASLPLVPSHYIVSSRSPRPPVSLPPYRPSPVETARTARRGAADDGSRFALRVRHRGVRGSTFAARLPIVDCGWEAVWVGRCGCDGGS